MQTKGLAGFYLNQQPMLIYQNNNAAPEELGVQLLQEIKDYSSIDKLLSTKENISDLIGLEETKPLIPGNMFHKNLRRHFPSEQINECARDIYELYKPFQGTLNPYMEGTLKFYPDGSDFIEDSHFCKWAYILNLDNHQFDILRGDQVNKPRDPTYSQHERNPAHVYGGKVYHPCAVIQSYALSQLPSEKQFLADIKTDQ